ncbi:hypothetical protein [Mesoplasma florum]|uniref:hypothetical protein n=1 Tax=Mesoplasma florum TaxID=2151 RepID=UPI0012FD5345|nr:hypothetical protein [Mesoplasma florum]
MHCVSFKFNTVVLSKISESNDDEILEAFKNDIKLKKAKYYSNKNFLLHKVTVW